MVKPMTCQLQGAFMVALADRGGVLLDQLAVLGDFQAV